MIKKSDQKKKGFTLVETLVTLGMLVMILMVVVSSFVSLLTRSRKARLVKTVESNGKYALRVMELMIRNSRDIESPCLGAEADLLIIANPDNQSTTFACLDEGLATGRLASNTARLTSPEVRLGDCYFRCSPPAQDVEQPKRILIHFVLSQTEAAAGAPDQVEMEFQTLVTTRNYD